MSDTATLYRLTQEIKVEPGFKSTELCLFGDKEVVRAAFLDLRVYAEFNVSIKSYFVSTIHFDMIRAYNSRFKEQLNNKYDPFIFVGSPVFFLKGVESEREGSIKIDLYYTTVGEYNYLKSVQNLSDEQILERIL